MELRVLAYFVAAAQEGNITRAARQMHITQPTISKQLKDLERELGHALFTRSNYNIKLTEAGQLFKKRAEDLLALAQKTKDEFKTFDSTLQGDIYIGSAESDSIKHFAKAVRSVQKHHPHLCCHLHSGNEADATERLDKGLLDFALVTNRVNTTKYEYMELPFYDKWGLVMRENNPLSRKKSVALKELPKLPLICSRQWLEQDAGAWLGDSPALHVTATYNLAYNAAFFVRENIGLALTYDKLINTTPGSGLCFRPVSGAPTAKMYIIWRKNQILSQGAKILLDELKERFGKKAAR